MRLGYHNNVEIDDDAPQAVEVLTGNIVAIQST